MRSRTALAGATATMLAAVGTGLAAEALPGVDRAALEVVDADGGDSRDGCDASAAPAATTDADAWGGETSPSQLVSGTLLALGNADCFAGLVVDEANDRVLSYWKGDLPAAARRYAEGAPEGVEVVVDLGARYSRAELRAAVERLQRGPLLEQIGAASVGIPSDGSGLKLWLRGPAPSAAQLRTVSVVSGLPETDLTITTDAGDVDTTVPRRLF